jgi:hypothetical protein
MIRPAQHPDIPAMINVIREAYEEMRYRDLYRCGLDEACAERVLQCAMVSDQADVSVVELDGVVAGMCFVQVSPVLWNDEARVVTETVWHMHPHWPSARQKREWFIRMLDHMRSWAESQGASCFVIGAAPGTPAEKLLHRHGLKHHENYYVGRSTWRPQR